MLKPVPRGLNDLDNLQISRHAGTRRAVILVQGRHVSLTVILCISTSSLDVKFDNVHYIIYNGIYVYI